MTIIAADEPQVAARENELEYSKDHFTPGWNSSRMFPRTRRRKKTQANRVFRRKSAELLTELKPGMGETDVR
jgi:hypothetical protein